MAVDPGSGTVYQLADAVGGTESAVRYYTSSGRLLRTSAYNAAGGRFEPLQMAFDAVREQVYVIGSTYVGTSVPGPTVYTTVAFGADGELLWARDFQGEAEVNFARDLAVDPDSGTVYVTGFSDELRGETTTTVAYSAAGAELWAVREPASVLDAVAAIGVDPVRHGVRDGFSGRTGRVRRRLPGDRRVQLRRHSSVDPAGGGTDGFGVAQ